MKQDRAFLLYYARVLMGEARARYPSSFSSLLARGARRARHEAMRIRSVPQQPDLFSYQPIAEKA